MVSTVQSLGSRRGQKKRFKCSLTLLLGGFAAILGSLFLFVFSLIGREDESGSLQSIFVYTTSVFVKPVVIAYAISLIKCGDKQSNAEGLRDAAIVLRHSIHRISSRTSSSRYDYHMIAIVHKQAEHCSAPLKGAGFELIVIDQPVRAKDIRGEFLRENIKSEWCCGAAEFVKLHAYKLTDYPIVVHVDIDFAFYKPMDDLFDVMLLPDSSDARSRIPLERVSDEWPTRVDAFMTRDWGQVPPGRTPLFQAGFIVLRPDVTVHDKLVEIIREGNYTKGYGPDAGWGSLGKYGIMVGAKAAQGLIAYYYDEFAPNSWMELNQCRFNHMGMDVRYRAPPNFQKNRGRTGDCRNNRVYCEDCMVTDVEQIYSVHYTQCRKPWSCIGIGNSVDKVNKLAIDENNVNLEHCMELMTMWHKLRTNLENRMISLTQDKKIESGQAGGFKPEVFFGHCNENGASGYIPIQGEQSSFLRIPELYGG